ncbi:MAG: HEPN domain-containing protein [Dysgonamonadaceae bacterium]|jgi:HEPN domain-containing protein|nr:HEPN domain-containing protein [Dysgonamonadaceae bacterium]
MKQERDKNETVSYWTEIANYDFETALAMQQTGRYLYVGFMCHQSVEKMLKAYYYGVKQETPPYIHSLLRLAESSNILMALSEAQLALLDKLEPLNIEARYPSYKNLLMQSLNKFRCEELLNETQELIRWIEKQL